MATNLTPWNGLDVEKLKVWVHHILPLVYDDSLSYYEVLAKVGAKMNEVIEGLNANNEQVEKVTGFTIEQVQNLTMAFNNFQQSMLTRQENFETKVLDSQQSFETQLKGDIADWEATTEEKFRQQYEKDSTALNNAYAKFLADYQRQFGVVQSFGDSGTDVISQGFITHNAFVFRADLRNTTYDLNNAYLSGIYNFYNVTFENGPENCTAGILLTYQRTKTANEPNSKPDFSVQMLYTYEGQQFVLYASRTIDNRNPENNTPWNYHYPKNEVGNSKIDTLSQDFITHNAFVFREFINNAEYDLDNAKLSGIYNFYNATISNAPTGFSNGMVIAYQRTESVTADPWQTLQMVYRIDDYGGMYLYATRVLYKGKEEWSYCTSLKNKSFVVLGDSWTAYPDWIPSNFKSWYPENTPLNYNEIWWYLLSKNEEMNIYQINAYTGTTIAVDDENPEFIGFITRVINSFSKTITTVLKPDYYIILGGANDSGRKIDPGEVTYTYTEATDKQSIPALSHVLSLLRQYNPNAKIFFFTQPQVAETYTNGFKAVCEHFNVHYEQLPVVPSLNGHPTNEGQQIVYNTIAKTLKLYS